MMQDVALLNVKIEIGYYMYSVSHLSVDAPPSRGGPSKLPV